MTKCDRCTHPARAHQDRIGECTYGTCLCEEFADEESLLHTMKELERMSQKYLLAEKNVADKQRTVDSLTDELDEVRAELWVAKKELQTRIKAQGPIPHPDSTSIKEDIEMLRQRMKIPDRPSSGSFDGND